MPALWLAARSVSGSAVDCPTLLSPERLATIVERVIARQAAGESTASRKARLERQLHEARAKVDRYVRAIGEGMDLAEVREQLTTAKATVATLEVQIATLAAPAPVDVERIRARVADWRGILRRGPAMARQILRKILPGKLELTPTEGGVKFCGPAAWAGLFEGTVYGRLVVAPG